VKTLHCSVFNILVKTLTKKYQSSAIFLYWQSSKETCKIDLKEGKPSFTIFKGICLENFSTMKILRDYFIKLDLNFIKLNNNSAVSKIFVAKKLTAVLFGAVGIAGITNLPSIKPAIAQVVVGQIATNNFTNPKLTHTFNGHKGAVKSVTFSPDGRMLVSGGSNNDGIIRLWNMKKKKRLGEIKRAHQESIQSLLISPDGKHLISSSTDNTVNIWSLENYKFIRTFRAHSSNVLSLAVTPDSKVFVSGALDGIRVWDLLQQRPLGTLTRFNDLIYAVAISPDGRRLVSGNSKGVVKLWDLKSGRAIGGFKAHDNGVRAIAFTPTGDNVITASSDRTVKMWNFNSGEVLQTFRGHTNSVIAIAVNPDGKTLASSGKDGIKIWDLNTGALLSQLYGHSDWVSSLAFSPDGTTLASGSYDKTVRLWESQTPTLNARLKKRN